MSTLNIFKECKILPEKNYIIDSINDYLDSLLSINIDEFQYIKHGLNLSIKVNLNQEELSYFESSNFNYISIQNDEDEYPIYYFILSKIWKSENTVELILLMDTCNSFDEQRQSFIISDRTMVKREHKDRYKVISTPAYTECRNETSEEISNWNNREFNAVITHSPVACDVFFLATNPYPIFRIFNSNNRQIYDYREVNAINIHSNTITIYYYDLEGIMHSQAITIDNNDKYVISSNNSQIGGTGSNVGLFLSNLTGYIDVVVISSSGIYPLIDLYSEGLNPILFKKDKGLIRNNIKDLDWYLLYINQNDPSESLVNPVSCRCLASDDVDISSEVSPSIIKALQFPQGKWIYAVNLSNTQQIITINGNNYPIYHTTDGLGVDRWYVLNIYLTGNKLLIFYARYTYGDRIELERIETDAIRGADLSQILYKQTPELVTIFYDVEQALAYDFYEQHTIKSINSINRTDPKIIKIIKLPYAPFTFKEENNRIVVDFSIWNYDSTLQILQLKDLNTEFISTLVDEDNESPFMPLLPRDFSAYNWHTAKSISFESKLFHSDYYQPKFIYDSFGFIFRLETMNIDAFSILPNKEKFEFNFSVTNTINSRMLFTFNQYVCDFENEDYNNILYVARNNEMTLYNQAYINYIKTGINYDVKSKERKQEQSIWSTVLGTVGAVASFISSPVTGGVGIAGGITLLTSTTINAITTANSVAQNEANLEQKKLQLQHQATSVYGADDVDLMSQYTGNRAKLAIYEISPKMKKAMFDVFYYTGYVSEIMHKPVFNTRKWFNFISCELEFDFISNLSNDILDNIKERFKAGVTIMHRINDTYDWSREYENWENSLNIPNA